MWFFIANFSPWRRSLAETFTLLMGFQWLLMLMYIYFFIQGLGMGGGEVIWSNYTIIQIYIMYMGRRGHDRMVSGIITTSAISVNHHKRCEFESRSEVCIYIYSIQYYVIKFVNDLKQVAGFLRVLRFPPPIQLTDTI